MQWLVWFIVWSCVVLEVAIVAFLLRWRVWNSFPAYFGYVVFVLLKAVVLFATLPHPQTYFLAYWLTAPVEILLTILATLESFWRQLRSFRLLRWFRYALPAAISTALAYAAWQGYRFPPVQATPAQAAIINATVAAHYVILAVALLFFVLVAFLHVSWRIHEHRFVLGFAVASLAASFGGSIRAVFGSHFEFVSREAQPLGYLVALFIWLSGAVHPVPAQQGSAQLSVENVDDLKFHLRNVRSFVRNNVR